MRTSLYRMIREGSLAEEVVLEQRPGEDERVGRLGGEQFTQRERMGKTKENGSGRAVPLAAPVWSSQTKRF